MDYKIYDNVFLGNNVSIYPYAVVGRPPQVPTGVTARPRKEDNKPTIIGDNCIIGSGAVIYSGCKIGKNTLIGDGVKLREQIEIGDYCIIGMNTKIGPYTIIHNKVKIMDLCNIAADMLIENGVFISQGTMCANDIYMGRRDPTNKGPTIRRFASIGANSTILPRIVIGENSIVGAGSIVAEDVPPKVLVRNSKAQYARDIFLWEEKKDD